MKKKQVIIVAAALAVVLLTGTAVYAIGNISPENNQVSNQFEPPSLSTAGTEQIEAVQTLTAAQVDISAYSVPLGTKAEQILRDTLTKKQMTEQEIYYYNALPSEIKMLTRAEAIERLEELEQWLEENEKEFSEYTDEEREQRLAVDNEKILYKLYVDCLATGSEHSLNRINSMIEMFEGSIEELEYRIEKYPNDQGKKNNKAMREFLVGVLYDLRVKAQNGDYDYDTIMDKVDIIENYFHAKFEPYTLENILSEEMFDDFAQRYESGESIESILG